MTEPARPHHPADRGAGRGAARPGRVGGVAASRGWRRWSHHCSVRGRPLLVARGDAPPRLETVDQPLDRGALALVVEDGRITRIYAIRNPHKLGRLDKVSELRR